MGRLGRKEEVLTPEPTNWTDEQLIELPPDDLLKIIFPQVMKLTETQFWAFLRNPFFSPSFSDGWDNLRYTLSLMIYKKLEEISANKLLFILGWGFWRL